MNARNAIFALIALVGCRAPTAPDGAQLLVPEDVEVRWDAAFNGTGDGLAAFVPADIMVYDGRTGAALPDVDLELRTVDADNGVAAVLSPDAVTLADVDDSGVWDAFNDRFVRVATDGDTDDRAAPIGLSHVRTDSTGLARVYVFVDAFPTSKDGDGFTPVPVVVSMGSTDDVFQLVPR